MKPIDGLRATAAITARRPDTRVVIVTQDDDPDLRAEVSRAGACAWLLKENLQELPALLTRDPEPARPAVAAPEVATRVRPPLYPQL